MVKSNSPFTLIAIEEHFLTKEVLHAWHRADLSVTYPSLAHSAGVIGERLLDITQGRTALMDKMGVDVQVLSLTTPALYEPGRQVWILPIAATRQ